MTSSVVQPDFQPQPIDQESSIYKKIATASSQLETSLGALVDLAMTFQEYNRFRAKKIEKIRRELHWISTTDEILLKVHENVRGQIDKISEALKLPDGSDLPKLPPPEKELTL